MRVIKYNINASNIVAIQIFAKYVDQHTCMFIYTHSQCMPCHTYNILIYNKIITRSGYLNINIDRESSIRINTQTQNQSINTYIGCVWMPPSIDDLMESIESSSIRSIKLIFCPCPCPYTIRISHDLHEISN